MCLETALVIGGAVALGYAISKLCGVVESSSVDVDRIRDQIYRARREERRRLLSAMRAKHNEAFEAWVKLKGKADAFRVRCDEVYRALKSSSPQVRRELSRRLKELNEMKRKVTAAKQRAHAAWQGLRSAYDSAKMSCV
jgi:hypothetical protein